MLTIWHNELLLSYGAEPILLSAINPPPATKCVMAQYLNGEEMPALVTHYTPAVNALLKENFIHVCLLPPNKRFITTDRFSLKKTCKGRSQKEVSELIRR